MKWTELEGFEVGSYNEWFSRRQDSKVTQWYNAIVAHSPKGVRCIAAHAGDKAALAPLHRLLTREFIENRARTLKASADLWSINTDPNSPDFLKGLEGLDRDEPPAKL